MKGSMNESTFPCPQLRELAFGNEELPESPDLSRTCFVERNMVTLALCGEARSGHLKTESRVSEVLGPGL